MKQNTGFFDILTGAIKRETEAFNYYYNASEKSPSAESKSLLMQLAGEERRYRAILVQEYKNLRNLLSGKNKEIFLKKEKIRFHLPAEPSFKRVQSLLPLDLAVVCLQNL
jgi:rubrerythrin